MPSQIDLTHPKSQSYRPGVGMMLVNQAGLVLVGQRSDSPNLAAWQMPQGGIDEGESPQDAALRELYEEIGVPAQLAQILAESRHWYDYELPPDLAAKLWGGKFRGQSQKWFCLRFLGQDCDINLNAMPHAEFSAWQWVEPHRLPDLIVPFKRDLYQKIIAEFASILVKRDKA